MMGSKLDDAWNEISKGAAELILSPIQYQIITDRRQLSSSQELREKYDISSDKAAIKCIIRTAYGFLWTPGNQGGRFGYLSDLDIVLFRKMIVRHATDFDCISRPDAMSLAYQLRQRRQALAMKILEDLHFEGAVSPDLTHKERTCSSWLNEIADVLGLKICAPQELEAARRYFCDVRAITVFFTTFRDVIYGRDPRLVFNMDETQLSAKKRFRVLTVAGKLPLVKAQSKLPHLTGIVTISAGGACFRPIVILKSIKTLKSLTQFCDHTAFATSLNGWITGDLFLMFAIDFCAQLTFYRLQLPDAIAKHRVLLVLDGHGTRRNVLAMMIFDIFGVDVLILPGHCTHVLQAFDVGIASALKTEFKKLLQRRIEELMRIDPSSRTKSDALRCILVDCFLNALHAATTPGNLASAFEATGFVPLNPERALASPFVHVGHEEIYASIRTRNSSINGCLLNSADSIKRLFVEQVRREMTEADRSGLDLKALWPESRQFRPRPVEYGIALTEMPKIWVGNEARTEFRRI
jgi:hypothetical protein